MTAEAQWVHLLPAGRFEGADGRGPYVVEDAAAVVAASMPEGARPLPIDYDHAMDFAAPRGDPAPAAGWIERLEARADGIWGIVRWTARAAKALRDLEYRFISPVFEHARQGGKVFRVLRAALTNNPNFRELGALAAAHAGRGTIALGASVGLGRLTGPAIAAAPGADAREVAPAAWRYQQTMAEAGVEIPITVAIRRVTGATTAVAPSPSAPAPAAGGAIDPNLLATAAQHLQADLAGSGVRLSIAEAVRRVAAGRGVDAVHRGQAENGGGPAGRLRALEAQLEQLKRHRDAARARMEDVGFQRRDAWLAGKPLEAFDREIAEIGRQLEQLNRRLKAAQEAVDQAGREAARDGALASEEARVAAALRRSPSGRPTRSI